MTTQIGLMLIAFIIAGLRSVDAQTSAGGGSAASTDWSISWTHPNHGPFKFVAQNRHSTASSLFGINADVYSVKSVHVRGSRVVIVGEVNGAWSITIFDLKNKKISDEFDCFYPAVSPDGRIIAFENVEPRASSVQDSVARLYDVAKSAQDNRTRLSRPQPNEWNAGIPIFPKHWKKTDSSVATDQGGGFYIWPPFYWDPLSKRFAFRAERISRDGLMSGQTADEYEIVLVDLNGDTLRSKTYVRKYKPEETVNPKTGVPVSSEFLMDSVISVAGDGSLEIRSMGADNFSRNRKIGGGVRVNVLSQHDDEY